MLFRVGTLLVALANIAVCGYFAMQMRGALKEIPEVRELASVEGHGAPAEGGHGAPAAGEHGAPAAGAHGAPAAAPAGEHGAPAAGHGAAAQAGPAAPPARNWMALDEMHVNIPAPADEDVHLMSFKIEMELFEDGARRQLEERQSIVKNAVLLVAQEQDIEELRTLAGKLYFKEAVVNAVNQALHAPLVRDVHLASFALQ